MAESEGVMESSKTGEGPVAEMESVTAPSNGSCKDSDLKEDVPSSANVQVDPFKKPAIFAAPSLVVKRAVGTNATRKISPESSVGTVQQQLQDVVPEVNKSKSDGLQDKQIKDDQLMKCAENTTPSTLSTEEANVVSERHTTNHAPAKTKQDVKPKFPFKPPPVGKFPPLPYTEPPWGGVSDIPYSFELLKNGAILDTIPLTQRSYFVVGRLPVCDMSLEHPSISRYHAIIQYREQSGEEGVVGDEKGFYVYDLGSTHGTFVNKNKIPPNTYIRVRVGHVLKFGGSTRLFILQGPEFDEEAESDLTVTELRERARKQRADLEKRMMGDGSDDEDEKEDENKSNTSARSSSEDTGCSWGMAEEAAPEEESEENPFATEFQEDQEAAYLKDPKKALQGFYDREGEELEFEYEEQGHGTWLCRIKLPVDDSLGRQLVAEVTHAGRKKEAAIQCSLEACRILEARGLLRQEAVSRKRKQKNWEEEDYYDSDDDTFLDRTGAVEKKRTERMKKAGKIQERPETYDSLVAKLAEVEKELADTERTLRTSGKDGAQASAEDSLDAYMSVVRGQGAVDAVERKKLHLHVAELRKESQRLRKLVELTRPTKLPSLQSGSAGPADPDKPRKLALPLFGAMKGGSKFRLKTGTIGTLPPKRANLPPELFNMKGGVVEEDEEEEEEEENEEKEEDNRSGSPGQWREDPPRAAHAVSEKGGGQKLAKRPVAPEPEEKETSHHDCPLPSKEEEEESGPSSVQSPVKRGKKRMIGPSKPPVAMSKSYPDDDPDYCVWVPPAGQSGDGRTHLNDKYGY